MFNKLAAVGVKVEDFDRSFSFYKDILELPIYIEDKKNQFAEFSLGNTLLALLTDSTLNDMSENLNLVPSDKKSFLFAVEVQDLDEICKKLKEKNVVFIQEPKSTPWGQKVAYFKDLDGYIWEISESSAK